MPWDVCTGLTRVVSAPKARISYFIQVYFIIIRIIKSRLSKQVQLELFPPAPDTSTTPSLVALLGCHRFYRFLRLLCRVFSHYRGSPLRRWHSLRLSQVDTDLPWHRPWHHTRNSYNSYSTDHILSYNYYRIISYHIVSYRNLSYPILSYHTVLPSLQATAQG